MLIDMLMDCSISTMLTGLAPEGSVKMTAMDGTPVSPSAKGEAVAGAIEGATVVVTFGGQHAGPPTASIFLHVSLSASVFKISVNIVAHVLPCVPTTVVLGTVIPSVHTGQGFVAGVGQHVS